MKDLDWDDLRFFLAVSAAGSLSAAARELNVNTTTVLRRIGNLEDALEAQLFERLRSGYTLAPVDSSLSSLQRDFQAASSAFRGQVRLSASEVIAAGLVSPALQPFFDAHPDIALDVISDPSLTAQNAAPRLLNVLRDIDIALRLERPTSGDMLVRKLCDVAYGLYGTAEYIAAHGAVPANGDLSGHKIIGFSEEDRPVGPVWWLSRAEKAASVVMRSSSVATRLGAVENGSALAVLPCFLANERADLQPLLGADLVGSLELWLLTRGDLASLSHVRAVMDFLVETIAAAAPKLAGH
jgi:DNA-binding transcriptional LysR family regulator